MPRQMFTDWRPDLPDLLNPGVVRASNVVPVLGGFGPMRSFVDAGEDALDAYCRGGWAAIDSSRNPHNFGGDATKLYRIYTSGLGDVSAAGGYNCTGNAKWVYAQFGQVVFAANKNDKIQYFNLRSSDDFADVSGDYVPRCRHLAVVGNHLICGNFFDGISGSVPNGVAWPAIGNPLVWPEPGSDDAVQVQSDRQALEGDGGWVQGVVGGAEIGAIFQERSIWRMDYRGGSVIYDFTRVEAGHGLLIPDIAIPFGRDMLFLSESGWRIFDYTASRPAGKERIDRWFFNDYDSAYPHRVTALRDPDSTRIWCSYPGAGNSGGTPNRLLVYDHALDRFTHGDEAIEALVAFITPSSDTLDSDPAEDIDNTTGSFDDEVSSPGAFQLGAWDTNHKLGSYSGAYKDPQFDTGYLELAPGRRSRVVGIRPLVNGDTDTRTRVAAMASLSETPVFGPSVSPNRSGLCCHRSDGRYHQIRTDIDGSDFVEALGLDIDAVPTGVR